MTLPLTFVSLAVSDVERSAAFYVAAGFERPPGPEGIALVRTHGSTILLVPRDELAADAGFPVAARGFAGVTFTSNRHSRDEVDAVHAQWLAAGATEVKRPELAEWGGYSGFVADPDGHLWECAYNPYLHLDAAGGLAPM